MVFFWDLEDLTYDTEEITAIFPVIPSALNQPHKVWERSAQKKCHPMACLGISSPRHYDCHWPSRGQATNWVFIHLFSVDLFSVNLLLLRANLLQNNKGKTCKRCTQEKGISTRITYMKTCIHVTVLKKKVCILKLVGKVDNYKWVSAVSLQATREQMWQRSCLPAFSPCLCNQIVYKSL